MKVLVIGSNPFDDGCPLQTMNRSSHHYSMPPDYRRTGTPPIEAHYSHLFHLT